MIPMTTEEERRINRVIREFSSNLSLREQQSVLYDLIVESRAAAPAPAPPAPEVEELLDILKRAEFACWAEHAECPSCGAEPDRSYHKYGIENGGHYERCRLAKALGPRAHQTRPK